MPWNHIGVDLSKDALDICDPRRGEARVANEASAIASWIAGLDACDLVVYEATSGCDDALRRALDEARQPRPAPQPAVRLALRNEAQIAQLKGDAQAWTRPIA